MKPPVRFRVASELATFVIDLARVVEIGLKALRIVIGIDKIITRVVRWIDVDHLDLAEVRLLKQF